MLKNGIIVGLLILVFWFGSAIVRLENQRYALELEVCGRFDPANPETRIKRDACLGRIQTRTGALYHLIYGLNLL